MNAAWVLLATALSGSALPKDTPPNVWDAVEAAINAGDVSQAQQRLSELDGDEATMEAFGGRIALVDKNPQAAIGHFRRALAKSPDRLGIWLYLSQAYFDAARFDEALDALAQFPSDKTSAPPSSLFVMKVRTLHALGRLSQALQACDKGRQQHPNHLGLAYWHVRLAVDARLEGLASSLVSDWNTANVGLQSQEFEGAVLALSQAARRPSTFAVIEKAVSLRPTTKLQVAIGMAYANQGQERIAARWISRAAHKQPKWHLTVADLWRRAGDIPRALAENQKHPPSNAQLEQRIELLVALQNWERAALSMTARMKSPSVSDRLRLVAGHVFAHTGQNTAALTHLTKISDPGLSAQAQALVRHLNLR